MTQQRVVTRNYLSSLGLLGSSAIAAGSWAAALTTTSFTGAAAGPAMAVFQSAAVTSGAVGGPVGVAVAVAVVVGVGAAIATYRESARIPREVEDVTSEGDGETLEGDCGETGSIASSDCGPGSECVLKSGPLADCLVAFKTRHGRFLSGHPDGTLCVEDHADAWETFRVVGIEGESDKYAVKTVNHEHNRFMQIVGEDTKCARSKVSESGSVWK
ncbi:hypothetical protein HDU98_008965 [Podochytrium sp. JEL0797]|nr:hypothetical protein HDU98_008965 [Podochytrium sp. JEL0797]